MSNQSHYLSRRSALGAPVAVLFAVMIFAGCVTTGPGGKKSFLLFGSGYEVSLGAEANAQILEQERILEDSLWQNYVTEIGEKVVAVCDRTDIEYHFAVIDSDQINAFALPGGYLYFYSGLLRLMDSEAQLASVVAHEISHVVARHGMKRVQKALIAQLGYSVVFGDSESSQVRDAALGISLGMLFSGYSRSAENEADEFGILYMRNAGYNPQGAVEMFERLASSVGGEASSFEKLMSSHPETQERIARAARQIEEFGGSTSALYSGESRYQKMKSRLPAPAPAPVPVGK